MNRTNLCRPNNLPLSVVCFGSGTGSTLEALLEEQRLQEKKKNPLFKIQAVVVNKECRCIEIAKNNRLPLIVNDRHAFFNVRLRPLSDIETATEYDEKNIHDLQQIAYEHNFNIDLIALTGYSSILSGSLVRALCDRIINSHPADLSRRNERGERIYAGMYGSKAILHALRNGEDSTKTCIHLVTEDVDAGEILVTSKPLRFSPEIHTLRYASESVLYKGEVQSLIQRHQELQKVRCDYPAYITAINLIASGRFSLCEGPGMRTIFFDGKPLPYEGIDLEQKTD